MAEAVLQFLPCSPVASSSLPSYPPARDWGVVVAWKQRWSQSSILAPPRGLFWG